MTHAHLSHLIQSTLPLSCTVGTLGLFSPPNSPHSFLPAGLHCSFCVDTPLCPRHGCFLLNHQVLAKMTPLLTVQLKEASSPQYCLIQTLIIFTIAFTYFHNVCFTSYRLSPISVGSSMRAGITSTLFPIHIPAPGAL